MAITNFKKSLERLDRAKEIIPTASQTYSKSYRYFCEGASPVFLERGEGSHVWDVDGNEYVDFVCALGAITVGYGNETIDKAVLKQLKKGVSFSQPTLLEIELAEKLIKILPSAEMVKFVKNGSDATSAAIRLARAYTKRDVVLCCGYHGSDDWYISTTTNDRGIPPEVKKYTKTFEYNNIQSLIGQFNANKGNVAAVIMEPMQGDGPKGDYLQEVKRITHENGALLVFDEVVSGFRMGLGGAQAYFNVVPDLSAFGKGMANGFSLSAVVGKKEILRLIDEGVFISSTFGGEALALAGALESIRVLEKPGSFEHIWSMGKLWKDGVQALIDKKGMNDIVKVVGAAPHCGVVFTGRAGLTATDLLSVYQQKITEQGVLTVGINNFCLAHTRDDVIKFVNAADLALDDVRKAVQKGSLEGVLKGEKIRPIFKR